MDQVTETFFFTLFATGALGLYYWLSDIDQEGRSNWSKIVGRYFVTSSPAARPEPENSVDTGFDEEDEYDVDRIANINKEGNVVLPDNDDDNESISLFPAELQRILERRKIETIAALIVESKRKSFQNGILPETRAITAIFGVTVSSKQESDYQRLRAMLKAELAKREQPAGAKFPELSEEQQAVRRELGLEEAI